MSPPSWKPQGEGPKGPETLMLAPDPSLETPPSAHVFSLSLIFPCFFLSTSLLPFCCPHPPPPPSHRLSVPPSLLPWSCLCISNPLCFSDPFSLLCPLCLCFFPSHSFLLSSFLWPCSVSLIWDAESLLSVSAGGGPGVGPTGFQAPSLCTSSPEVSLGWEGTPGWEGAHVWAQSHAGDLLCCPCLQLTGTVSVDVCACGYVVGGGPRSVSVWGVQGVTLTQPLLS